MREQVDRDLDALLAGIEAELLARPGSKRTTKGDIEYRCLDADRHQHGDKKPSAWWSCSRHVFKCQACGAKGGWKAMALRLGLPTPKGKVRGAARAAKHRGTRVHYLLHERDGTPAIEHHREVFPAGTWCAEHEKHCTKHVIGWKQPNTPPREGWGLNGRPANTLPLYGCHELPDASEQSIVVLVEGFPARDALMKRGILAVATVAGANVTPTREVLSVLIGSTVILWPDAHTVGRKHLRALVPDLQALGIAHRTVEPWPTRQDGTDAADWTGTTEELVEFLAAAPDLTDAADPSDAADPLPEEPAPPGVLLAEIPPEKVRWLWWPRLPRGKVVVITGAPDEGKTTVVLDLAARVSAGLLMPLEDPLAPRRTPAGVVVLSAEDDLADTIVPRLQAAGADMSRIVSEKIEDLPSLDTTGLLHICRLIDRVAAALIVVDPLAAFVPDVIDMHRDHHSRRMLRKLAGLAQQTGVCILVVRHPKKGGAQNAKDAGGGSVAIGAAARVELFAGADPVDNPTGTRKVLARVKGNLTAPFPALAYELVEATIETGTVVRVKWIGLSERTATEIAQPPRAEPRDKVSTAVEVLRRLLANGPLAVKTAKQQLREAGVSKYAWEQALGRLGIVPRKEGFHDSMWVWGLPEHPDTEETGTFGSRAGDSPDYSSSFSSSSPEGPEGPDDPGRTGPESSASGSSTAHSREADNGAPPPRGEPYGAEPPARCGVCGWIDFHRAGDGWTCSRCHPPPDREPGCDDDVP
jgi:hypothetical protein